MRGQSLWASARFTADRLVAGRTLAKRRALVRPWPCEGRDDRWCPGARLSEQPGDQRLPRRPACNERERAARAVRVSSAPRGHRRYRQHLDGELPAGPAYQSHDPAIRAASASKSRRTFSTVGAPANSVRQAETQVLAARLRLESTVQQTLFRGAEIYMNVLRDTAILNLQRNNVEVLDEQLRQSQDRFEVGGGHPHRCRAGRIAVGFRAFAGQSGGGQSARQYRALSPDHRRRTPANSAPGGRRTRWFPAISTPRSQSAFRRIRAFPHPASRSMPRSCRYACSRANSCRAWVCVARYRIAMTASGGGDRSTSASVVAQLTVPLYQGGETSARVRQAKESVSEARFELEQAREEVRSSVITSWGALEAARAQIMAAEIQVDAAETALTGVREEARVGATHHARRAQCAAGAAQRAGQSDHRPARPDRRGLCAGPGHGPPQRRANSACPLRNTIPPSTMNRCAAGSGAHRHRPEN